MTCSEFSDLATNERIRRATNAELAALVSHGTQCEKCTRLLDSRIAEEDAHKTPEQLEMAEMLGILTAENYVQRINNDLEAREVVKHLPAFTQGPQ